MVGAAVAHGAMVVWASTTRNDVALSTQRRIARTTSWRRCPSSLLHRPRGRIVLKCVPCQGSAVNRSSHFVCDVHRYRPQRWRWFSPQARSSASVPSRKNSSAVSVCSQHSRHFPRRRITRTLAPRREIETTRTGVARLGVGRMNRTGFMQGKPFHLRSVGRFRRLTFHAHRLI